MNVRGVAIPLICAFVKNLTTTVMIPNRPIFPQTTFTPKGNTMKRETITPLALEIGERVTVVRNCSGCFIGESGEVYGFDTNLLGMPLIEVLLDGHNRANCFYRNELQRESVE